MRLAANRTYRDQSHTLFSRAIPIADLDSLEPQLTAHLDRAARILSGPDKRRQAFQKGEATCHAGLMWRYGHRWRAGDPLVAVDSEARVGFESRVAQTDDDRDLRARLGLASAEALPKKLDTLGVSRSGDLLLVEVKDAAGSIERAVKQVAAHVERFSRLLARGGLRDTVQMMLDQKREAGLIPLGAPSLNPEPRIVPWIAAPDEDTTWPAPWIRSIDRCRGPLAPYLKDLLLVRLSADGIIRQESSA